MAISEAINAAVSKALLEQSGNDRRPNLKENLLNVKGGRDWQTIFEYFSGVFQYTEPKDDK